MSSKRWTKNPTLPKRYRPGKGEDVSSEDDYSDEEEQQVQQQPAPPPKKLSTTVRPAPRAAAPAKPAIDEDEFETESEGEGEAAGIAGTRDKDADNSEAVSDDEDEESSDGDEDEEESETSSEDEAPKLLRPTFIRKDQRAKITSGEAPVPAEGRDTTSSSAKLVSGQSTSNTQTDAEWRRKEADALVQDQIEKQAAARAAGKKYWDDDDDNLSEDVDDTDGVDAEAELAAWKLRELKRVKRARDAIEAAEKEREEIERRRGLTREEREREDAEHLEKQREDREGRGEVGYMKRYFHRGAFFQGGGDGDEEVKEALRRRDIMGARFVDEMSRDVLPEYMQIRDMTKLGRKGRSKYKDLRSEDTGRWGDDIAPRRDRWRGDERFAPDRERSGTGPQRSGANAAPVGERHRRRSRSRDSRKRSHSPSRLSSHGDDKRRRRDVET